MVSHLPERAGTGTVEGNLTDLARGALGLYRDMLPLGSSLFADPELLERFRAMHIERGGGGPHRAWEPVVAYLRAEQDLGRVDPGAGPAALPFHDPPGPAPALVVTLLAGLVPTQPPDPTGTEPTS